MAGRNGLKKTAFLPGFKDWSLEVKSNRVLDLATATRSSRSAEGRVEARLGN